MGGRREPPLFINLNMFPVYPPFPAVETAAVRSTKVITSPAVETAAVRSTKVITSPAVETAAVKSTKSTFVDSTH